MAVEVEMMGFKCRLEIGRDQGCIISPYFFVFRDIVKYCGKERLVPVWDMY